MNAIMYDGKKSVAEGIVYGALDVIEAKTKQNPLSVFQQALDRDCRYSLPNVLPGRPFRESRQLGLLRWANDASQP